LPGLRRSAKLRKAARGTPASDDQTAPTAP
jgi:hypothetical protein